MSGIIRYFGSKVVFGDDCQPLDASQEVNAIMKRGSNISMSAGRLDKAGRNTENYPVSYTVPR